MIESRHHARCDLVIHVVAGSLDEAALRQGAAAIYGLDPPPLLSLWDLSDASISGFTPERMGALQSEFAESASRRRGGKTAVVASEDLAFGVARQYQAYAEVRDLPIEHQVFRSVEDALAWLDVDVGLLDPPDEGRATP